MTISLSHRKHPKSHPTLMMNLISREKVKLFLQTKNIVNNFKLSIEMKNLLKVTAMLLCVVTFATFTSCSKDSEDLIVGKWQCTYNSQSSNKVGFIWEFKSNGKMTTDDPNDLIYGTEVEYTINGDVLTIAGLTSYTIDELTSSCMELTAKSWGGFQLKFEKK